MVFSFVMIWVIYYFLIILAKQYLGENLIGKFIHHLVDIEELKNLNTSYENGVGRIGKLVVKLLVQNQYNLTHLNEINGNTDSLIHSIEFDSVHGKWQANIEDGKDEIKIDGKSIKATFVENINDLSLDDVDIMIDCTGVHKSFSKLQKYFDKGVKKGNCFSTNK